ncbi:AAEL001961-PA [Aedes aegypti]|uniref:AAEL001961-PA n=1 Tax=Aedes aegypti TaxID=7159 RepID=Q17JL9_AEDAE|nr:AAEL001961-PA [Aedes aegypti]
MHRVAFVLDGFFGARSDGYNPAAIDIQLVPLKNTSAVIHSGRAEKQQIPRLLRTFTEQFHQIPFQVPMGHRFVHFDAIQRVSILGQFVLEHVLFEIPAREQKRKCHCFVVKIRFDEIRQIASISGVLPFGVQFECALNQLGAGFANGVILQRFPVVLQAVPIQGVPNGRYGPRTVILARILYGDRRRSRRMSRSERKIQRWHKDGLEAVFPQKRRVGFAVVTLRLEDDYFFHH